MVAMICGLVIGWPCAQAFHVSSAATSCSAVSRRSGRKFQDSIRSWSRRDPRACLKSLQASLQAAIERSPWRSPMSDDGRGRTDAGVGFGEVGARVRRCPNLDCSTSRCAIRRSDCAAASAALAASMRSRKGRQACSSSIARRSGGFDGVDVAILVVGERRRAQSMLRGAPTVLRDWRVSNHSGTSHRGCSCGACRSCWASCRRWVTAGVSARSLARIASRMSRASPMSLVSVTTSTRFSSLAAGDRDVQAAAGGGRGGEGDAGGLGVGLVAGFGGGVAEPDVFADVVGGEGDGAVSVEVGHGQLTAVADGGDGPQFAVADDVAGVGVELAVVAAGGDHVADEHWAVGCDRAPAGVELAVFVAAALDAAVDRVDVVVGGGRDRHRLARAGGRRSQ